MVEIAQCMKIAAAIAVSFAEKARFDQVENNFADVIGGIDTPELQNCSAHAAKLLANKREKSLDEFLATDMVLATRAGRDVSRHAAAEFVLRVRESLEKKFVGLVGIPSIAASKINKLGMLHGRHGSFEFLKYGVI